MIDSNLIIAGAVRNVEPYIDQIFENIDQISKLFSKVKIVLVESDSNDNTLNKINGYKSTHPNLEVISLGSLLLKHPSYGIRCNRIAAARNVFFEIAENSKDEYQHLLVIDMDDICAHKIKDEAILSNFRYDGWDMITANQSDNYYDIWGLRHDDWMPYDCWELVEKRPSFMSREDAINIHVRSRQIHIDENHPLIKVKSSFGGMGFIKIDSIKGARSQGQRDSDGRETCDWVSFCARLNAGNPNIFINPKFITNPKI